jgi:ParB-like chromosome segregation protein Spo0J
MNTSLNTPIPAARGITGEGWAAIAGAVGSAFLLAKKLLSPKGGKSEAISRAEFYAELMALKDNLHREHLALLEKLDAVHLALLDKLDLNHRELLAELARQGTRINTLEAGLARVDERTRRLG